MVNAVNVKTGYVVGISVVVIVTILGIYISAPGEDAPASSAKSTLTRGLIALGFGSVIGLVAGSMVHQALFSMANPEIAVANYAIGQTRQAVFGKYA